MQMMRLLYFIFTICTLLLVRFISTSLASSNKKLVLSKWKECASTESLFLRIHSTSLESCITRCNRTPRCLSVNYRRNKQTCELLSSDTGVLIPSVGSNGPCVYVRMSDITGRRVCNCGMHEVCNMSLGTCEIRECSPISLQNGVTHGNMNSIRALVKYDCSAGYAKQSSQNTVTCLQTGQWDHVPTCLIDCWEPAAVQYAIVVPGDTLQGTHRSYGCVGGYSTSSPLSDLDVVCEASGNWTSTSFTCDPDIACGSSPPAISNSNIASGSAAVNVQRIYTCNSGYTTGTETVIMETRCQGSGSWTAASFTCYQECSSTIPTLSNAISSTSVGEDWEGKSRLYTCSLGFSTGNNGIMATTCQSDGTWSTPNTQCVPTDCGEPDAKSFATLIIGGTSYNTHRNYVCINGYSTTSPASDQEVVCQASGDWSTATFTCQPDATIGDSCSSSSDCFDNNAVCVGSVCLCNHLYSFDSALNSCTQVYTTVLDTFTHYANLVISGYNSLDYHRDVSSIDECKQLCIDDPSCLSFEIIQLNNGGIQCNRGMATYDMVSQASQTTPSVSWGAVYSRQCS